MTDPLARLATALADRYRIERELGQGGMASVYLAEDVKHHRKVALKVLKSELAAVIGAERFLKEIEVTANLQHPNILPLYDSGEAGSFLYYVMPYVEGDSLRDKLDREKQLGLAETVEIARSVAAALQYAHERDIIHRDIKPENILLQSGQALVADFGIALAVSHAGGTRLTETGLSLGTPHYMSPEQATGDRELDARSDVYSLGAMVYEMLTGEPPHSGTTVQAIVAKILTSTPEPVTKQRTTIPPNVSAAVHQALNKLPADRFSSAAQFADALTNRAFTGLAATGLAAVAGSADARRWKRIAVGSGAIAVLAIAVMLFSLARPDRPTLVVRLSIRLPDAEQLVDHRLRRFDLAPDGSKFVYMGPGEGGGGGGSQLWVRDFAQLNATPVRGTRGACCPTFSPDGRAIAYIESPEQYLKVIDVDGGAPTTVIQGLTPLEDLEWGADGYLYLGSASGRGLIGSGPLVRVRADGSSEGWEQLTTLDSARAEDQHTSPSLLPNGKGVLFNILYGSDAAPSIGILDLQTRTHRSLAAGSAARYVQSGHLIYADFDGSLMAVPFDQNRMEITGPSVALGGRVTTRGQLGSRDLSVTDDGTMLYGAGEPGTESLVWVDRQGDVEEMVADWVANFETLALSPDGRRLAVSIEERDDQQLWIRNLPGGSLSKVTIEGSRNFRPFWARDGERLLFVSNRRPTGKHELYARRVDGGVVEPVLQLEREIWEGEWSPDGQWLIYRTGVPPTRDLFVKHVHPDSVGRTISASDEFQEVMPTLSPDGRWLAYQSDETGRFEVYVRPFPNIDADKRPVSTDGGTEPKWSRDGTELFYKNLARSLVAAKVDTRAGFSVTGREVLFAVRDYQAGDEFCCHPTYDVSLDGQRFSMIRRSGGTSELILVQNIVEELKSKVGN